MNRALTNGRIAETSPRFQARLADIYYVLIIVIGLVILFFGSRLGFLIDVIATAFYLAVTALFYSLTKAAPNISRKEKRV